jgi:hypothetical protein
MPIGRTLSASRGRTHLGGSISADGLGMVNVLLSRFVPPSIGDNRALKYQQQSLSITQDLD